jgi:hypothetical protein
MYYLLQQCRDKLAVEASQPTVHLRILVGHVNTINVLIEGIAVAEETYRGWSDAKTGNQRSTEAESQKVACLLKRKTEDILRLH